MMPTLPFVLLILGLKNVVCEESDIFNYDITDDADSKEGIIPLPVRNNERDDAFRIIGGVSAENGEYPWMAALYRNGRFLCTFSIISPSWILGAAHCVVRFGRIAHPPDTFSAIVGNVNRSSSDTKVTFSKVIVHNRYGGPSVRHDIALLKMATPLTMDENIQAICISAPGRTYEGKMATSMGWGNTLRVGRLLPDILQVVRVDIANRGWCGFIYWLLGFGSIFISKEQICAGSNSVGVCNGDSGGPLVFDDGSKNITIGVTSFGTWMGCAPLGVPSVYTAVSQYNDWIKNNIDEEVCES